MALPAHTFLLCVASAAAQTEAPGTAGKPLSLLQFIHKNGDAKLRPHSETAAKFATRVLAHSNGTGARRTAAAAVTSAPRALAANVDRDRAKLEKATVQAGQPPAPEMPVSAAPKHGWPGADPAAPGQMSILTPRPALTPQPAPDPAASGAIVEATPAPPALPPPQRRRHRPMRRSLRRQVRRSPRQQNRYHQRP